MAETPVDTVRKENGNMYKESITQMDRIRKDETGENGVPFDKSFFFVNGKVESHLTYTFHSCRDNCNPTCIIPRCLVSFCQWSLHYAKASQLICTLCCPEDKPESMGISLMPLPEMKAYGRKIDKASRNGEDVRQA